MTPLQVLTLQESFLARHEREPEFREYVSGCFGDSMAWAQEDEGQGSRRVRATLNSFRHGSAYRVREDMCDLLVYAADRLDETDVADSSLAPSPYGFVVFERPLPIRDARGMQMLCHYMTWSPVLVEERSILTRESVQTGGSWLTMWNDPTRDVDDVALSMQLRQGWPQKQVEYMRRVMGRFAFIGTQAMVNGHEIGTPDLALTGAQVERMLKDDARFAKTGIVVPPPIGSHTNPTRYLHALWLLLGQTISDVREDPLSKAAAKQAGRMRVPGIVTVVQLRRREGRRSEGETHVEWMHRWMVRGHWRWQPYGDGTVRRIYIAPFVKGPEDRPFKQSRKIYDLSR